MGAMRLSFRKGLSTQACAPEGEAFHAARRAADLVAFGFEGCGHEGARLGIIINHQCALSHDCLRLYRPRAFPDHQIHEVGPFGLGEGEAVPNDATAEGGPHNLPFHLQRPLARLENHP